MHREEFHAIWICTHPCLCSPLGFSLLQVRRIAAKLIIWTPMTEKKPALVWILNDNINSGCKLLRRLAISCLLAIFIAEKWSTSLLRCWGPLTISALRKGEAIILRGFLGSRLRWAPFIMWPGCFVATPPNSRSMHHAKPVGQHTVYIVCQRFRVALGEHLQSTVKSKIVYIQPESGKSGGFLSAKKLKRSTYRMWHSYELPQIYLSLLTLHLI